MIKDPTCIFCSNSLAPCYNSRGIDVFDCLFCKSGLSKYSNSYGASKYEIWYENGLNNPKTGEYVRLNKYALRQNYQDKETRLYTLLPEPYFELTITLPIIDIDLNKLTDNQIEAYILLS